MPGRSKSERAGWLALLVLVLTAALSVIACEESTSEAPPAPPEAEPAQAESADDPTAQPEEADAPEQPPRQAETSQSEAAEDEEASAPVEPEAEETAPTAASASPPDDAAEEAPAETEAEKAGPDTEPPEEPGPVEPEVEETEPDTVTASLPDDAAEQPPAEVETEEAEADPEQLAEPANGAGDSEAPEPAQDATAVEDEEPQPSELAVVVPDRPEAVTLYAGPAIDWAALATLEPGAPLTIIGRAPYPMGPNYVWLLAEMPDGARGWLTADDMALDPDTLSVLRELEPSEMEVITSVPDGAWIRRQPDHASPGCELPEGGPAAVVGRSPDGEWSLVSLVQRGCQDPVEWYYGEGWIHDADLADDPILSRAPVVYPHGLWLFPVDPQIQPTKLPVCVFDTYLSEAWSFDPEDGSLVFTDHCSSEDGQIKRYTTGTTDITIRPGSYGVHFLVAPIGGTVLRMSREDWGSWARFPLTLIYPNGRADHIGYLYVYCQCGRGYLLGLQARWSPDGQAIIVRDTPSPEVTDPDYSDFWLYRLPTGERVDLRQVTAAADLWLIDAQFHPDGQSIYAYASHPSGQGLLRLTLEGDEWPGFSPIETSEYGYEISPRGDRIITEADGTGRIFTDQGELLGERAGVGFQWLPDGDRIAYLPGGPMDDRDWTIEHLPSGRTTQIYLPSAPHWSPDGDHIAVMDAGMWWSEHTFGFFGRHRLQLYDVSGQLIAVYRFEGCYRHQWLPDGSQLAVSVFPHCPAP